MSGVLKNALDHIDYQMTNKPAALASHGSHNGAFAIAQLRVMLPELGVLTTPKMLGVPYGSFDDKGNPVGDLSIYEHVRSAIADEISRIGQILTALRG